MIRKSGKNQFVLDNQGLGLKQPNLIEKMCSLIVGFANCLAVRLFLFFVIGGIVAIGITDFLYPYLVEVQSNRLVAASALDLDSKSLTSTTMDSYMHQTHAAWCYVTNPEHKDSIVCHSSAPFDVPSKSGPSQMLTIKGRHYYQTTAHLNNGNVLHLAFALPDALIPKLVSEDFKQINLPAQYVLVLNCVMLAFMLMLLETCVAHPLNHLADAVHSFISLRNVSTFTAGGIDVPGAVTEVKRIRNELVELRRQYDELNSARVAKDAEMRRLKSTHEKEKVSLVAGYKQQLASTQQKVSELRTKEVEEEFMSSLSHEFDLIRSSQQLCERVLERVNNKYPSSVVFSAFFKVYESLNYELTAHLAFDAQSIQILRSINHFGIAQQVFGSGQYLHINRQNMLEQGLEGLAQHNNINHAIYMPLTFQNRNLGMFAFYVVPEAVNMQEMLRTLRIICDIASRVLYQLILYEEASTAARTDLLTDLPNRKFLEEIFPIILERASAESQPSPVSVIVIHPDQLRTIAEGSGRIAVDRILKELARVLKDYMNSSPSMQEHEAHLVRFATEDFMLILDNADLTYAAKIAEQIQQTIESKSTWPGGIASITVSQGMSTYPDEGSTPSDLINTAEAALMYGRETLGPGNILHARGMPAEYLPTKNLTIDGNLSVFDAGGLLQSVANSRKTGVLTVESSSGDQLWTLFETGKPAQARLDKLKAEKALIEFMVTFEEGTFSFNEIAAPAKLPRLDDSYNIKTPLDRIVMDGALAQDNLRAAKQVATS